MKSIELKFNNGNKNYILENVESVSMNRGRLNVAYTPEGRPDQQLASYDLEIIKGYFLF